MYESILPRRSNHAQMYTYNTSDKIDGHGAKRYTYNTSDKIDVRRVKRYTYNTRDKIDGQRAKRYTYNIDKIDVQREKRPEQRRHRTEDRAEELPLENAVVTVSRSYRKGWSGDEAHERRRMDRRRTILSIVLSNPITL